MERIIDFIDYIRFGILSKGLSKSNEFSNLEPAALGNINVLRNNEIISVITWKKYNKVIIKNFPARRGIKIDKTEIKENMDYGGEQYKKLKESINMT